MPEDNYAHEKEDAILTPNQDIVERKPPDDEPGKQPSTPEERRKHKFSKLHTESDDARSDRRAAEFLVHLDAHMQNVAEAHEKFPAPLHRGEMTEAEVEVWNQRRGEIDSANKAYYNSVRRTFAEHRDEEVHLGQLRAAKAKETV